MQDIVNYLEDYCSFDEESVYILLGVARSKHNPELNNNNQIVFRKVVRNKYDIERKYRDLVGQIKNTDKKFYTYISINSRNIIKAYFHYKNRMNNWLKHYTFGDEEQLKKLKSIDKEWISVLQKPENRNTSYFLFDIDDKRGLDDLKEIVEERTNIITIRPTYNGHHMVTEPFNYKKMCEDYNIDIDEENWEIQFDRLLFLEYIDGDKY